MLTMKESFRCGACAALLFKAERNALAGLLEIKCRRCRQINQLRPASPSPSANRDA
ncbi:MAG: Com family DNA-binding transcriptional regulator [Sphingomonadaceae bacterium]|nr:Com family DNA-binding transcriptional regulator [Sphingomonadaceae bacterium]